MYGRFEAGQARKVERAAWKDTLSKLGAYKALDIADDPEDDVNIKADKTTNISGVGPGMFLSSILGVGALAVGAPLLSQFLNRPTTPPPSPPAVTSPAQPSTQPPAQSLNSTGYDLKLRWRIAADGLETKTGEKVVPLTPNP